MARTRTHDSIKVLNGTAQPCRLNGDTNTLAIVESLDEITLPAGMNAVAKKIFKEKALILIHNRILSVVDVDMLAIYANAMATCIKAQRELNADGHIIWVKDDEDTIIGQRTNLWSKVLQESVKIVNQYGVQFGFSPVSRLKIAAIAVTAAPKNDFANFEEIE